MSYRPITDVWILARSKVKYYGAYPAGFLERARSLLGVTIEDPVLHVCAGRVRDYPFRGFGPYDVTADIDPRTKPDHVVDVTNKLPTGYYNGAHGSRGWAAILADPPYTEADAKHYGDAPLPTSGKLLRLCLEHVRPGGRVGMLCYEWPRPPKWARCVALVGVAVGFGNRGRLFSVFERPSDKRPE